MMLNFSFDLEKLQLLRLDKATLCYFYLITLL